MTTRKQLRHTVGDNKVVDVNRLQRLLRQRMDQRGWTQSEVARRAGLSRQLIGQYLNGETLPTPDSIAALAKGLELPAGTVLDAVAEARGYRIEELPLDDDDKALLAVTREMPPAMRVHLQAIAEEMAKALRRTDQ